MMLTVTRLDEWFATRLNDVSASQEAKAYVVGVLCNKVDIVTGSVVLEYIAAANDFVGLQSLGDAILFASIIHPGFIAAHRDMNESIARVSYYRCHKILDRKWPVYEELADNFPVLVTNIKDVMP